MVQYRFSIGNDGVPLGGRLGGIGIGIGVGTRTGISSVRNKNESRNITTTGSGRISGVPILMEVISILVVIIVNGRVDPFIMLLKLAVATI